ncbi:MAG TPA: septation protein A [Rhizomicrobium sp.]|jgi:intracellular septation protein
MSAPEKSSYLARLALDLGPLVVFFGAYEYLGIFVATGCFMVAVLVALAFGYWRERRLAPMPLFTAVLVLVFGGLTLYLRNADFIKMKPTVLYALFAFLLLGGMLFNQLLIKYVFGQAFQLRDAGWRSLTWRWAAFFFLLAALNEFVWRDFSTSTWVYFKVWLVIPLIFVFALAQTPLILKHEIRANAED